MTQAKQNHAHICITSDTRQADCWIHGIFENRFFSAKVYDEPSTYGVNDCRVSKLAIGKTVERNKNKDYFKQCDYNYDRGLDFNNLPDPGILDRLLKELNALPVTA